MLPKGWSNAALGEVVDFLDNKRVPIKEADRKGRQGDYPYYGASGIIDYVDGFIFDDDLILLGEDGANILNRSTPLAYRVSGKCWVNNHAHVLKPKSGYDIDYLTEYLESLNYAPFNTGTAQPKLNRETCWNIPVRVPPFAEQQNIGRISTTWDRAIELTEKLIAAKQKRKQALMQRLLTGRVRFAGSRGSKWKRYHLGELFSERREVGREDLPLLSITSDRGVISRDEVDRKDTSTDSKAKYKRIAPGDIGYNTMRMWQGVSALSQLDGIVSPAYTICVPGPNIDARFASYLFKSPPVVHLFYRYSQGLVSDTWNLKFTHFAQIQVQIPLVDEQRKIAAVFSAVDAELRLLRNQVTSLRLQKKGLMQQLLTGKVRVKVNAGEKCPTGSEYDG